MQEETWIKLGILGGAGENGHSYIAEPIEDVIVFEEEKLQKKDEDKKFNEKQ